MMDGFLSGITGPFWGIWQRTETQPESFQRFTVDYHFSHQTQRCWFTVGIAKFGTGGVYHRGGKKTCTALRINGLINECGT
ncbi:MAG TPA: hypothetical protein V6C99_01815, partial [Oculatellaceae cyanobacterium]